MANNPPEAPTDDFFEQILGLPTFASIDSGAGAVAGGGGFHAPVYHQLGLSLEQGKGASFFKPEEASGSGLVDARTKTVRSPFLSFFILFSVSVVH